MKTVYTCFCTDVIHEGHLNIIREAQKYGKLTVGVLSDEATIRFNRFPTISLEERIDLIKNIPGVENVIVQNEVMYDEVFEKLHPDYVIHGTNWQEGALAAIRANVQENCRKYGAEMIEVPYTSHDTVRKIDERTIDKLAMPEFRRGRLRKLLKIRPIVKIM